VGPCEQDNENSCSVKGENFFMELVGWLGF